MLPDGEDNGPGTDPEIPTKGCGRSPDADGEPSKCSHVRDFSPLMWMTALVFFLEEESSETKMLRLRLSRTKEALFSRSRTARPKISLFVFQRLRHQRLVSPVHVAERTKCVHMFRFCKSQTSHG